MRPAFRPVAVSPSAPLTASARIAGPQVARALPALPSRKPCPAARLMIAVQASPATTRSMVAAALRRGLRGSATLLRWAKLSLLDVLGGFGFPAMADRDGGDERAGRLGPARRTPPGTGARGAGVRDAPPHRSRTAGGRQRVPPGRTGALPAVARWRGPDGQPASAVSWFAMAGYAGVRLADGEEDRGGRRDQRCRSADRCSWTGWTGCRRRASVCDQWKGKPAGDGYESKIDAVVAALPTLRAVAKLPPEVLPV